MRRLGSSIPVPVRAFLLLAVVLIVVLLLARGSGSGGTPGAVDIPASQFDGAALPATIAPPFTLRDLDGREVSLSSFHGHVVILAFLYSTCAPGCILIAQQIRGALDELRHPIPVLIVSVDPAADRRQSVEGFLRSVDLSGRVSYLTGPRAELERVWQAYEVQTPRLGKAAYERAAPVYLIDGSGRERVLYESEQLTPEALSHDVGKLDD